MIEFSDLSTELQQLVIEELDHENGARVDLQNSNLVNRKWHDMAQAVLFKKIVLEAKSTRDAETDSFFEFLFEREDARNAVKEVYIPIPRWIVTVDFQNSIQRLLPMLPNLALIRLGGDSMALIQEMGCEDSDDDEDGDVGEIIFLNPFRNAILEQAKDLQKAVALDQYVYTQDTELDIESVHVLQSLKVTLLNMTLGVEPYDGSPSKDVAKIISNNPNLTNLSIELEGGLDMGAHHGGYDQERVHALENIVPALPALKSLALGGDFTLSDDAWTKWEKEVYWSKLKSLTLNHPFLVEQFSTRLQHTSTALTALKLNMYTVEPYSNESAFPDTPEALTPLLSKLPLTHLSLTDLRPSVLLTHLETHGPSLTHLRFHITNHDSHRLGPSYLSTSDLKLTPSHLSALKTSSPHLTFLGLDVSPTALSSSPTLSALAALPALTDLRLYLHYGRNDEPPTTSTIVNVFANLRKEAKRLQSLVVCRGDYGYVGLWALRALGERKVAVDLWELGVAQHGGEVWDLESGERIEGEGLDGAVRWRLEGVFGVGDGW